MKFGVCVGPYSREGYIPNRKGIIAKDIIFGQVTHYNSLLVWGILFDNIKYVPQVQHSNILGGWDRLVQMYGVCNRRVLEYLSTSYPSLMDNLIVKMINPH